MSKTAPKAAGTTKAFAPQHRQPEPAELPPLTLEEGCNPLKGARHVCRDAFWGSWVRQELPSSPVPAWCRQLATAAQRGRRGTQEEKERCALALLRDLPRAMLFRSSTGGELLGAFTYRKNNDIEDADGAELAGSAVLL